MRLLLILFMYLQSGTLVAADFPAPRQVDERRAAQLGVRKIVGRHLRLYTDVPPSDAVDGLAVVFDAAVPIWAKYFDVDPAMLSNWRMQGYLIRDRAKFDALGLLPNERKDFPNGYSNGYELWVIEQSSDYFRRHLLLHEGTHGFMYTQLGNTGAGWYMEGIAELLGTHRWQDGELEMRVMPRSRGEVPMWGRIRLVRDAVRNNTVPALAEVISLDKRRAFSTSEYAWCWALCEFLDSHPRWNEKFRSLYKHVGQRRFNKHFRYDFRKEWTELHAEWQAFIATLDYGYDAERMAMSHKKSSVLTGDASVQIAADGGWQSTGWRLKAGVSYQLSAAGRYEIAREQVGGREVPWPSEPGGVTLQYHEGSPLGMLMGAWRTLGDPSFSTPFEIGLRADLKPPTDAVLYLRVNDSAAQLSDNRGELTASIRRAAD